MPVPTGFPGGLRPPSLVEREHHQLDARPFGLGPAPEDLHVHETPAPVLTRIRARGVQVLVSRRPVYSDTRVTREAGSRVSVTQIVT